METPSSRKSENCFFPSFPPLSHRLQIVKATKQMEKPRARPGQHDQRDGRGAQGPREGMRPMAAPAPSGCRRLYQPRWQWSHRRPPCPSAHCQSMGLGAGSQEEGRNKEQTQLVSTAAQAGSGSRPHPCELHWHRFSNHAQVREAK